MQNEIPWDWYAIRASALVGFLLLYISVFLGTVSCLPHVGRFFARFGGMKAHCWISVQAIFFVFLHAMLLLFHRFIPFGLADIFIPFHSEYKPLLVSLGIFAFYLMIILTFTSYARRYISHGFWRAVHFLNLGLYVAVFVHALFLGMDLKAGILRQIFIWMNAALFLLLAANLIHRIRSKLKNRPVICEIPETDENLRQGYAPRRRQRDYQNFRRRV